ncbi:hypothetical protein [Holospora curviuscula]|uniref:F0F1 ATP synthase subunit B n=1 Tax=Holospora curviuscula TaxID=1082868 RepID=A0A2S5R7P2_9PROT|nr:hypothetical protein [Holospora curviuscula]PPE03356.1 F0F1 ATP synthase subunit B' [Holospora curviuscula]
MPQFDSHFFPSQIFWVCACFGVLWVAMHWWIIPRVRSIQAVRSAHLATMMEEVQRLHAKSADIHLQCDTQQEHLEKLFQNQIFSITQEQEKIMAQHLLDLKQRFDLELSRVKEELFVMEKNFMQHIQKDTTEIAQHLIQQYLQKENPPS